jgi:hypothetical protein
MMGNRSATTSANIPLNNDEMASTGLNSMEISRFAASTNSACSHRDEEDESCGGGPKRQRRTKTEDPTGNDYETAKVEVAASIVPATSSFQKKKKTS